MKQTSRFEINFPSVQFETDVTSTLKHTIFTGEKIIKSSNDRCNHTWTEVRGFEWSVFYNPPPIPKLLLTYLVYIPCYRTNDCLCKKIGITKIILLSFWGKLAYLTSGPGTVIKRSWTNRFLPARTACTVGLAVNGLPTFFLLDEKSKM